MDWRTLGMAGSMIGEVRVGVMINWVVCWMRGWTGGRSVGHDMNLWGGKGGHRLG